MLLALEIPPNSASFTHPWHATSFSVDVKATKYPNISPVLVSVTISLSRQQFSLFGMLVRCELVLVRVFPSCWWSHLSVSPCCVRGIVEKAQRVTGQWPRLQFLSAACPSGMACVRCAVMPETLPLSPIHFPRLPHCMIHISPPVPVTGSAFPLDWNQPFGIVSVLVCHCMCIRESYSLLF